MFRNIGFMFGGRNSLRYLKLQILYKWRQVASKPYSLVKMASGSMSGDGVSVLALVFFSFGP